MKRSRLSKILGKCSKETIEALAEPIMQRYPVSVIRKPTKTLVMVRMQETVAKADFYLGEMLACEALVEVEGKKGFALMAGDDRRKVLCAAVLDAVCKTQLSEKAQIVQALEQEEKNIAQRERHERKKYESSKVQFHTLDVEY